MGSNSEEQKQFSTNPKIEKHREMILEAKKKGGLATFGVFARLSGPGWLQSAITIGGGSLSSSLYLGILVGFTFMWLQPLAMILGVVMLSAIAYVTLSTGQRPLRAINEHVSPVLGWGWLIASMMANIVWSMPQFNLATAAIQQNLFSGVFGVEAMPDPWGKIVVGLMILAASLTMVMFYIQGSWGVKVFEVIVKLLVGSIVIGFFGVVVKLTLDNNLDWGKIWGGFIPNLELLMKPVEELRPFIAAVNENCQSFWNDMIVMDQRDVMISAAATAVGINMTFLLPYSMLRKGWDKDFRGLAIFDLSTGLFIPFILATGCVVIAATSQFHAKPAPGLVKEDMVEGKQVAVDPEIAARYKLLMEKRMQFEMSVSEIEAYKQLPQEEKDKKIEAMPLSDRRMASMVVKRDAFNLADSLAPLTGGKGISRYIFGFGILGMGLNAATMLMLINGLCFCELLNKPAKGWTQRIGSLMVSVGILGPFFWTGAKMWIAVPTSVFAMTLLPVAYFSFFFLMNQKKFLGDNLPRGGKRHLWNILMAIAALMAAFVSIWSLWAKLQWLGIGIMVAFIALCLIVHMVRSGRKAAN